MSTNSEFIDVGSYPTAPQAHAAKNFLDSHGIRAFVIDEYTATQSWSNFQETKLQVAAVDAERAKELLSA